MRLLSIGCTLLLALAGCGGVDDNADGVVQEDRVVESMPLDTSIVPRPHSTIPGYYNYVEQCGEFVYRYFHTKGRSYPTLGQPAEYILSGAYSANFPAYRNNGTTQPHAGDILAAKGAGGEYHTALVYQIDSNQLWVYQANVPAGNGSTNWRNHVMAFPLQHNGSRWFMPDLQTSRLGYRYNMGVVGWIHPKGAGKLPGAKGP